MTLWVFMDACVHVREGLCPLFVTHGLRDVKFNIPVITSVYVDKFPFLFFTTMFLMCWLQEKIAADPFSCTLTSNGS